MIESAHWKISLWRLDIADPVTVRGDTRVVFGLFYKSMSFLEMYSIRCQQSILSIQVWHHFPHRNTFIVYSLIGVQSFWMRSWWLNQHFQKISVCRLYIADPVTLRGESRVVSVCLFSLMRFSHSVFNRISAFIVSHIWMRNMSHIMSYVSQICSVSYMECMSECMSTSSCIHCAWTRCEFNHF